MNKRISQLPETVAPAPSDLLPIVNGGTTKRVQASNLVNKQFIGLSNVDNTSDVSKPVSTATQSALDALQAEIDSGSANIDDAIDDRIELQKGAPNGLADLDADSKIPSIYIPGSIDDVIEAASFASLPVTGETNKIYVTIDTGKTYRWGGTVYVEISASPGSTDSVPEGSVNLYHTTARASAAAPVQSVAGKTGAVSLVKVDVGLGNVDNTADANKPLSTAATTALAGKEPTVTAGTISQYYRGDKTFQTLNKTAVGLANVDNTSDASKPISTAVSTALAGKQATITAGTTSQYYRGDKTFQTLDATAVGLNNVDNTSDANKPVSTAAQTALNLKANDADVVHDTGDETIAGVKTFSSSPIVPTPTTISQAVTKAYADEIADDALALAVAL